MLFQLSRRFIVKSWTRSISTKVVGSAQEAVKDIPSNITLLSGGFGLSGVAESLIDALLERNEVRNITAVSNNAGLDGQGLSKLLESGQIVKMVSSYIGSNKTFERMYLQGEIDLELTPQGTMVEKVRAGAAGIPAFYTATGVGTWLEEGKLPVRYDSKGNVVKTNAKKETREFNGKKFLMEESIFGDVAFVKAYKADTLGNCWFKGTSNNFNGAFGRNAKITIVEAEHIVQPGEIPPENVHLPSVYVNKIIQSHAPKDIEILKLRDDSKSLVDLEKNATESQLKRIRIVKRASREFGLNTVANLGIGMPNLSVDYVDPSLNVLLQSENGILGMGPNPKKGEEDPDLINSGKETVTLIKGAAVFGSDESFGMIRGGKIGLTMLGGLQVAKNGDLANWGLPGRVKGMGGAMDLVSNPKETRVVVLMEHVDKKGRPKILNECKFPLTGTKCVSRIITDLAVFDVIDNDHLRLIEIAENTTVEEIKEKTEANFEVADSLGKF